MLAKEGGVYPPPHDKMCPGGCPGSARSCASIEEMDAVEVRGAITGWYVGIVEADAVTVR
jgi:hypothetical protein